jgi:hypothetical protein
MPEARRQLEQGQCATPVAVLANRSISSASSFTQWACQTSDPGPAQILGVLPRTAAEILQRISDVLVVLGEMGVHHHALVSRQKGGIAHQLAADGKGRAGRDGDADHGAGARIVEAVDDADAVVEDIGFVLDKTVGRQTARRLPDRHGPSRGVKTQTDLARGRDRVVKPRAVGEEIEVIGGHRAARQRQFRQTRLRRDEHVFGREARPDRVKRLQPAEKWCVLCRGHGAGQRLEQVMMGIHQPRRHQAAACVDDRAVMVKPLAKLDDFAVVDPDIGVPKLRPGVCHGDDAPCVPDQERTHPATSARSASASAWSAALEAASTRPPPWAAPPDQSVTTPPAASITAMGAQMS